MSVTTAAQEIIGMGSPAREELPERYWELVDRYRGELINQALAIVGSLEDAEDVVQETFCEAFRNGSQLAQARSLGAWLRTINRGNALNRLRGRRKDSQRLEKKAREDPQRLATTGGFSVLEMREIVARSVETLPPKLRAVVVLRYLEHLSYEEIAKRLGLTAGTVGWMLCEAAVSLHGKLKGCVDPQVDSSGPDANQGEQK